MVIDDSRPTERTTVRMDTALKVLVKQCADAAGQSMNDFMVEALVDACRARLMERTEAELAPIIGQKLDDTLRPRLQSLRDYLGRLHAEQHRTQFFLYYLMRLVMADEMPLSVENDLWEQGWVWAVSRLQHRPKLPVFLREERDP